MGEWVSKEEFADNLGMSKEDFNSTVRLALSMLDDNACWSDMIQEASKLDLSKIQLLLVGLVFGRTMQTSMNSSGRPVNPELS